jgi:hypothetical protein
MAIQSVTGLITGLCHISHLRPGGGDSVLSFSRVHRQRWCWATTCFTATI